MLEQEADLARLASVGAYYSIDVLTFRTTRTWCHSRFPMMFSSISCGRESTSMVMVQSRAASDFAVCGTGHIGVNNYPGQRQQQPRRRQHRRWSTEPTRSLDLAAVELPLPHAPTRLHKRSHLGIQEAVSVTPVQFSPPRKLAPHKRQTLELGQLTFLCGEKSNDMNGHPF